jgi:membrane protease subunit HflK
MSDPHPHSHPHPHRHPDARAPQNSPPNPESTLDAGSQALAEALRSSFTIVKIVMVVLLIIFMGSGIFTVGPQERAIILRLGKPVGEGEKALLGPGFHLSWPYPIDEYVKVSISGIQKVTSTVGWYATTPEMELAGTEPPAGGSLSPAVDGYVLTADGNIAHARATLTYRIHDPIRYVFGFLNASNAIQSAVDNALLYAASRYRVDDLITRDVIGFNETVRRRATELINQQNLGVTVEQCSVRSIPPRQLKDAFDNVLKAEVNRSRLLNDARSYENQVVSKAGADAQSRLNMAESDRSRLVNDVAAQAERFRDVLPQYRQNPSLFVQQRLSEMLSRSLTNVQDKVFLTESSDGKTKELRLLLNREPPKMRGENK